MRDQKSTSVQANFRWHEATEREVLADQLANEIAEQLAIAIELNGLAVLAVSGGSTPKPLFQALATKAVDWSQVVITLVDERWVPVSHNLSNQAFVETFLLSQLPSGSRFAPLYSAADSAQESLAQVLNTYCEITNSSTTSPKAFDVVVLGMGDDGHTASFFPDAPNIAELVDPNSPDYLLSCESASTQVARITWTVPMLLNTKYLALHITGKSKRSTFEAATNAGAIRELPIRCALFQEQIQLQVYYAD